MRSTSDEALVDGRVKGLQGVVLSAQAGQHTSEVVVRPTAIKGSLANQGHLLLAEVGHLVIIFVGQGPVQFLRQSGISLESLNDVKLRCGGCGLACRNRASAPGARHADPRDKTHYCCNGDSHGWLRSHAVTRLGRARGFELRLVLWRIGHIDLDALDHVSGNRPCRVPVLL